MNLYAKLVLSLSLLFVWNWSTAHVPDPDILQQLAIAQEYAQTDISAFKVGAIGITKDGEQILGANIEFPGIGLEHTVHAEQSVLVQAFHRRAELQQLYVTHVPCGFCRQTLSELRNWTDIQIYVRDQPQLSLEELYAQPFSAEDLGRSDLPPKHTLAQYHQILPVDTDIQEMLFEFLNNCYSPYSAAPGAVVIQSITGKLYGGSYLENAAFNPSIPPLRSALIELLHAGDKIENIERVYGVDTTTPQIDHRKITKRMLKSLNAAAKLQWFKVTGT